MFAEQSMLKLHEKIKYIWYQKTNTISEISHVSDLSFHLLLNNHVFFATLPSDPTRLAESVTENKYI